MDVLWRLGGAWADPAALCRGRPVVTVRRLSELCRAAEGPGSCLMTAARAEDDLPLVRAGVHGAGVFFIRVAPSSRAP